VNNLVLNWPKIETSKELTILQMLLEHLGYLQQVGTNTCASSDIPGFEELVSDWESGVEMLRQKKR